jgi:hypothetical protein
VWASSVIRYMWDGQASVMVCMAATPPLQMLAVTVFNPGHWWERPVKARCYVGGPPAPCGGADEDEEDEEGGSWVDDNTDEMLMRVRGSSL